jgi:hypothetical protein
VALYTVRRTRVLRVHSTGTFEVEADNPRQAIERALEDDDWSFVEDEREVLSDRADATLIPDAKP